MKILELLKSNVCTTTVFFETDDEFYDLCFTKKVFGRITSISVIKGKRGEKPTEGYDARVICTSPPNIISRLKRIGISFKNFLKEIFQRQ